jgi:hypothetical protein
MLKPVDPAALAPLQPPGWSVSPAYPAVSHLEAQRSAHQVDEIRPMKFIWHL